MIIATSRKPLPQPSPTMRVASYARMRACSISYPGLFGDGRIEPNEIDLLEVCHGEPRAGRGIFGRGAARSGSKQVPTAKIVVASGFGAIIQWYDFFIFGTARRWCSAASSFRSNRQHTCSPKRLRRRCVARSWRIRWQAPFLLPSASSFGSKLAKHGNCRTSKTAKNASRMAVLDALIHFRREPLIAVVLTITEVAWVRHSHCLRRDLPYSTAGDRAPPSWTRFSLALMTELFVMPLSGWLSDGVGRRTINLVGTAFGILLAFPIFWLFLSTRETATRPMRS